MAAPSVGRLKLANGVRERCLVLLQTLMGKDCSLIFNEPIDVAAIPMYAALIKQVSHHNPDSHVK
jgi:hypothetical protein